MTRFINIPKSPRMKSKIRLFIKISSAAFFSSARRLSKRKLNMRLRYSRWTHKSRTDEQRLQELLKAFSFLMLKTNGDVQEALDWLRELAERYGIFGKDLTLKDIIEKLKEMGIIDRNQWNTKSNASRNPENKTRCVNANIFIAQEGSGRKSRIATIQDRASTACMIQSTGLSAISRQISILPTRSQTLFAGMESILLNCRKTILKCTRPNI